MNQVRAGAVLNYVKVAILRLVVKKGHIEEARYLCDKKNRDVQQ